MPSLRVQVDGATRGGGVSIVLCVLCSTYLAAAWRVCDVTDKSLGFVAAVGDGLAKDTVTLRRALRTCDEVVLPAGKSFLSGPLNLTTNQVHHLLHICWKVCDLGV